MLSKLKSLAKAIENRRYFGGWSDYPGKGRITDKACALYAIKHLHWWDRFDLRKVGEATLVSWHILAGVCEPKEFSNNANKKNWKFY